MLQLQHISKTYYVGDEAVHALADVSLHVRPHEFVAICGPSGSGKTTLMNVMGCLDLPDAGTYILDGVNIADCNDRELSRIRSEKIGFVFQQFNLLDQMSALENVELPMIYQKVGERERRERAQDALTLVGLGKRMQHRPSQLSGGQQQRVAIARALASGAQVILADEPTGNLDSRSGTEIMRLICDLAERDHTIVLITHNQEVADMAGRTVYVHDGRLYETREEVPSGL
ncbi:aBC-type antimicrobial peptide transport system ATPase component [Clostridium sp. CAG:1024]|nr:ABC transporter ATP-binding protein [Eubacteriales bacterium]CCX42967.1 aBC-type antimicrobial peptide transport system ATPase component [Clostridium sp. CAG:1024]